MRRRGMKRNSPFYKDIEVPIRPLVKLLRENGWNTTCSCGHGMWVELDVYAYMDELEVLRSFLIDYGYKTFDIEASIHVQDLWPTRKACVYVNGHVPCDGTSAKEYEAKIRDFKRRCEKMNQENYQLRTKLEKLETGGV